MADTTMGVSTSKDFGAASPGDILYNTQQKTKALPGDPISPQYLEKKGGILAEAQAKIQQGLGETRKEFSAQEETFLRAQNDWYDEQMKSAGKIPGPPELRHLPEYTPPQTDPKRMAAFVGGAFVLAALVGGRSSNGVNGMLGAFSAALNGYAAGDKEAKDRYAEDFKNRAMALHQENEDKFKEYYASISAAGNNMKEVQQRMYLWAAKNNNTTMLEKIREGNYADAGKVVEAAQKANDSMLKTAAGGVYRLREQDKKNATGGTPVQAAKADAILSARKQLLNLQKTDPKRFQQEMLQAKSARGDWQTMSPGSLVKEAFQHLPTGADPWRDTTTGQLNTWKQGTDFNMPPISGTEKKPFAMNGNPHNIPETALQIDKETNERRDKRDGAVYDKDWKLLRYEKG